MIDKQKKWRRRGGWSVLACVGVVLAILSIAWGSDDAAARLANVRAEIRNRYSDVPMLSTAELANWLADDSRVPPLLLDVRKEVEFSISHLKDARRVDLGYENMGFEKGYLEALPLESGSVDLVLSNCVLNLSSDKRRTFAEILRVLKPAGRVLVSDVVTETVPSAAILNDDILRGECIARAIADVQAARCCQRDVWTALTKAAELSNDLLPISLRAETPIRCRQFSMNKDRLVKACPLWADQPKEATT